MIKSKYKACFDDVKGNPELLEKILSRAEEVSENSKRIKLVRMTKYAASVAAAAVVVVSAVFLYNNGFLEQNVVEKNVNEVKITDHELTEKKLLTSETEKTSDNTSDKTADTADTVSEKKAVKKENENYYAVQKSKVATAEETQEQGTEKDASVNTESMEIEENSTEITADTKSEEIETASITDENEETDRIKGKTNEVNAQMKLSSGGGGGGSSAAAVRAEENMLEAYDAAAETGEETEKIEKTEKAEKTYAEKLTVFKEGIMNIPENEYSDDSKKILVYTNEDRTKKIELTFIRNTDRKPPAEGKTLIETKNGYVIIEAENISKSYLDEIASYYADK